MTGARLFIDPLKRIFLLLQWSANVCVHLYHFHTAVRHKCTHVRTQSFFRRPSHRSTLTAVPLAIRGALTKKHHLYVQQCSMTVTVILSISIRGRLRATPPTLFCWELTIASSTVSILDFQIFSTKMTLHVFVLHEKLIWKNTVHLGCNIKAAVNLSQHFQLACFRMNLPLSGNYLSATPFLHLPSVTCFCHFGKLTYFQKHVAQSGYSPLDASDQEDQVAIDLGAVDKLVDVAGIYRLSRQQAACPNAITNCKITKKQSLLK